MAGQLLGPNTVPTGPGFQLQPASAVGYKLHY
jgi:hypothetical protein